MSSKSEIKHNESQHDKVSKFYNLKHTEIYNDYEQSRLEETIDFVIKSSGKNPGELKVLDFGAGTGNLSRLFAEKGCRVTACDVSQVSLDLLKENLSHLEIETVYFDGQSLPFEDDTFDIVASYSVLHHIPDYLASIKEVLRVTKKGGYYYIEHEASEEKWNPSDKLKEYQALTRQTFFEHLKKLYKTRELFTYDFFKAVFMKTFVDKRYEREGDIHVWPDDHIEWDKVESLSKELGAKIFHQQDYLLYRPKVSIEVFNQYKDGCSDAKLMIIEK